MNPPTQPGLPNADDEHLRQLTLFHNIYAVMQAAFTFFGLSFFGFGLTMALRPDLFQGAEPPPILMSVIFQAIGLLITVLTAGAAFCTYLTGRYINQRRNRTFCLVIAGINCLSMPLGTALGIFTIVVLARPQVKVQFH